MSGWAKGQWITPEATLLTAQSVRAGARLRTIVAPRRSTRLRTIVSLHQENERLRQERAALAYLAGVLRAVADLPTLLSALAAAVAPVLGIDATALALYAAADDGTVTLTGADWSSAWPGRLDQRQPAEVPAEWAMLQTGQPVFVTGPTACLAETRLRSAATGDEGSAQAAIAAPLRQSDQISGCLYLIRTTARPGWWEAARQQEVATFVEEVASLVAAAVDRISLAAAAREHARLYQEARQLAACDPLTGLANYRHLQERLDEELARADRAGDPLAVAMVDLDRFKSFNDTHGHLAGDDLLCIVAQVLRAEARQSDVIGRYGGDEFTLVLPGATREGALAMIERVRTRLQAAQPADETPVALSVGIAVYPADGRDRRELLASADVCLYADKARQLG